MLHEHKGFPDTKWATNKKFCSKTFRRLRRNVFEQNFKKAKWATNKKFCSKTFRRLRRNVFEQNFLFVAHFVSGKPLCPALHNIKMRVSSKKSFTLLRATWTVWNWIGLCSSHIAFRNQHVVGFSGLRCFNLTNLFISIAILAGRYLWTLSPTSGLA